MHILLERISFDANRRFQARYGLIEVTEIEPAVDPRLIILRGQYDEDWCKSNLGLSTMKRKQTQKAKAFGASGRKSVNNKVLIDTIMRPGRELVPARNFAPTFRMVRRFIQNGVVTNQTFTLANGHDQFLVVTAATGAAVSFIDSWRIRKIKIWTVGQLGAASSVVITAVGSDASNMNNDREAIYSISSRSNSEPASMEIIPSKTKPLGGWHFTSALGAASGLFQMNVGTNAGVSNNVTTMEIEFDVVHNYAGLPLGYTVTTATTTVGTIGGRNILSGFTLIGINSLG